MSQRNKDSAAAQAAYDALVDSLADARPWGYRAASDITLGAAQLHIILLAHGDMAEEALSSPHLAADITDELNSVYSADTEDARVGVQVRQRLLWAAQEQVHEDVQGMLRDRIDDEADDSASDDAIDRAREVRQEAFV